MTRPDTPAQEHADTSALAEWVMLEMRDRFGDDFRSNALDALLAEVERLTAERDEALRQRDNDRDVLSEMYAKAERERDEARASLRSERLAYNNAHERAKVQWVRAEAAEALAERRGDALMLADHLADRYGRYWAKDESFYRYMDARAALADEGQE